MSFALHRREIHKKMARNLRPSTLQRLEQSRKDRDLMAKSMIEPQKAASFIETPKVGFFKRLFNAA